MSHINNYIEQRQKYLSNQLKYRKTRIHQSCYAYDACQYHREIYHISEIQSTKSKINLPSKQLKFQNFKTRTPNKNATDISYNCKMLKFKSGNDPTTNIKDNTWQQLSFRPNICKRPKITNKPFRITGKYYDYTNKYLHRRYDRVMANYESREQEMASQEKACRIIKPEKMAEYDFSLFMTSQ